MWCPKALFLPHKYLDIILCYTVCQAILPTALFLFLPIYIMSERQWEAEVYWFYSAQEASRQQILSLREKGHLTHKPLCWSENNASMKWLKIEKKVNFWKENTKKTLSESHSFPQGKRGQEGQREIPEDITKGFKQYDTNQSKVSKSQLFSHFSSVIGNTLTFSIS